MPIRRADQMCLTCHRNFREIGEEEGECIVSDCCSAGEQCCLPPVSLLRMQSWLSPTFPTGSYSYSHGIEWAVEAGHIHDREGLVDWLEADLCYGSGRNAAIFFIEAWRASTKNDSAKLLEVASTASPFAAPSAFPLASSPHPKASPPP